MSMLESWGIALVLILQQLSPALDAAMRALSFLGQEEFFLVAVAFVYLCVDARWGARLLGILIISVFINDLFKLVFHAPRPYWIDERVKALSAEGGYGIPSGHAQNAVALWGLNAAAMHRRWAWIAAGVLVAAISLSRLYLGVHFPHDIVAGWLLGGVILTVFLKVEPRVTDWLRRKSLSSQIGLAAGVSLVMLCLTFAGHAALAGVVDSPGWETLAARAAAPGERAIDPRSLHGAVAIVGAFLGLAVGVILNHRLRPFDARGPWRKRLARLALALIVLIALRAGLGLIFPSEPSSLALVFRYIRYALMSLWAIWLAPIVSIKVGLATEQTAPA
jgi:membrane-associated phospholipid phosphatase